jgi:hypothetical protein
MAAHRQGFSPMASGTGKGFAADRAAAACEALFNLPSRAGRPAGQARIGMPHNPKGGFESAGRARRIAERRGQKLAAQPGAQGREAWQIGGERPMRSDRHGSTGVGGLPAPPRRHDAAPRP